MSEKEYRIEFVSWLTHQEQLLQVRRAVFIEEQLISEADEIDGIDHEFHHVLCSAVDDDQPLGCARIAESGKIGRVAIIKAFRGKGLGIELMQFCIDAVLGWGKTPYLDAQVEVIPFYERVGFLASGDVFLDANIPHRRMSFALPSFAGPEVVEPEVSATYNASDATNLIANAPIQTAVSGAKCEPFYLRFLEQSSRDLLLKCPIQMASWIASESRLEALKQALLSGRVQQIFVLLDEKEPDLARISGIVQLARRLPSRIQLRCVNLQASAFTEASLINNTRFLYAKYRLSDESPQQCGLRQLSAQQELIERESFFRVWDHQTWSNPYLRELNI